MVIDEKLKALREAQNLSHDDIKKRTGSLLCYREVCV